MYRKLLPLALCLVPTVAHAEWVEATSPHFVVYADDNPEKVRKFATRLEQFDQSLRKLMGASPRQANPAARVTIFYLDSTSDIARLYGSGGRNVGGFYEDRASGSVAFVPHSGGEGEQQGFDSQVVLFHEYAHHFMYSNWTGAAFPKWFSEGFAEFCATAIFRGNDTIVLGAPPNYRSWGVGQSMLLPARRLLLPDPGKLADDETQVLYARGWALFDYMLSDTGRAGQLAAYIGAVNAGRPIEEANALLGNVALLDGKLNAHVKRPTFTSFPVNQKDLSIGEVTLRSLSPGEAATMPARIRSERGVDEKIAPEVAALARRLAAPYVNDAAAQNELAEAEFDAGNYAASEAAADRAIAADPKSIHALLYKGMAQMEAARKDKVTDPVRWQTIRRWFLAANKLDKEDPQPLILFYQSFGAAGQKPTANAESALVYAYALAPYDMGLRLNAAAVLLGLGRTQAARVALEPVAYSPHAETGGAKAAKVLEILDAKGPQAALEALMAKDEPVQDSRKKS